MSIQYSDTWRAGSVKTFCSSDYEALEDSACLRGKTNINTCIGACTSTPSLLLSIHMTVDTLSRMVFSWRAGVQPQQNFLRYPSASKYIFLVPESVKVGASILYEGVVPKYSTAMVFQRLGSSALVFGFIPIAKRSMHLRVLYLKQIVRSTQADALFGRAYAEDTINHCR